MSSAANSHHGLSFLTRSPEGLLSVTRRGRSANRSDLSRSDSAIQSAERVAALVDLLRTAHSVQAGAGPLPGYVTASSVVRTVAEPSAEDEA
jgi:hypothetical protein